jgi:hypothetical protein
MNPNGLLLLSQARIRLPATQPFPRLGGAALGDFVHLANESDDSLDQLYRQLDV